jgi:colicin import membrane protein
VTVKVDKTLVASIALHVLVIGWGVVSFTSRSMEAPPPESLPVDIISADQLSKITAGIKTGEKDKPKPMVEKVADATPVEDAVGKITEKKEIITSSSPEPPPKPVEKPVEKKPDPPKPVVENKPKEEQKPQEKKPDPAKEDPIAEAIKKQEAKKPPPKQETKPAQAQAQPQPPKPKQERVFDQTKIAALLDKRDPTRQAITGATLNASASLGTTRGTAATLSQSELDAMRARLASLWNVQPGIEHPEELFVTVRIHLGPDRRLTSPPQVVSTGSSPRYKAAAEAAVRAVLQGQPYNMLRDETFEQWKFMDIDFDPKSMFRS